MNSCLYECRVMHYRLEPMQNVFYYNYFMFYIDLEEMETHVLRNPLVSRGRWNLYTFRDRDHLHRHGTVRSSLLAFIRSHGITQTPARIMLLTNLRTLGYAFNPVCFYFCLDALGRTICAVAEVHNTFGEMKPYFIPATSENEFHEQADKLFYVSPFIDMDSTFEFRLTLPAEQLRIQIDDHREGRKFFISTLTGRRRPLTTAGLLWLSLKFPLVTAKIITLIHWQALRLWWRGLPFFRKQDQQHLQQEIYHRKSA